MLFGLNNAIKSIGEEDSVIVVEGYFDAIALYQAGIKNVVACQGTALTRSQVHKALKYTQSKKLVILFDGDTAGQTASERSIETLSDLVHAEQIDLRLLSLPGNQDPDDWLKTNSSEKFLEMLKSAPYWLHWILNRFLVGKDLTNPHDITSISENFAKTLSKLQSEALQSYYMIYAGELLGGGDPHRAQFYSDSLSKTIGKPIKVSSPTTKKKDDVVDFIPSPGLCLVNAWVQHPGKRSYINGEIVNRNIVFADDSTKKVWNYLMRSGNDIAVPQLIDELIEEFESIRPIEQLEFLVTWHGVENLDGWIKQLKREAINAQIDYYKNLWTNCDDAEQNKYYFDIWNKLIKLLAD
jgi:DNA primase